MKSIYLRGAAAAAAILAASSAFAATNLIVDGNFSNPPQGGGWSFIVGGVDGWNSTSGEDPAGIEIGTSPIYGLPCVSAGCQNLEVDANNFDTVSYTVSGLTVGTKYDLSYLYGGRTSGGPDFLDVSFGGSPLTVDSGSIGVWTPNNFVVTATATSETLVLAAQVTGGLPSFGNEITNVSLSSVPEPATWATMLIGFAGLGYAGYRRSRSAVAAV